MKIGFVGLGAMGRPMAKNLVSKGFEVTGYDINPASAETLIAAGGHAASSPSEAARGADVLVLMVVNTLQARDVLLGAGALQALPEGKTVLFMVTGMKADVAALAEEVTAAGRRFVDAPVSGGVAGAGAAALSIMVAGAPGDIDAVRPVMEALGDKIHVVGDAPGQGAVAKTVNQLLCGVHIAAAAEALSLAEQLGLDTSAMLDIVTGSAASSWMLKDRGPRMLQDAPEVTSAVDIFCKDLGIVLDTGRDAKAALPLAAAALQLFLAASGRGEGAEDDSQVLKTYRAMAGR